MARVNPESSGLRQRRSDGGVRGVTCLPSVFDQVDCFAVKQNVEYFEAVTGIETENSYQVLGAVQGRPVFGPVAAQESSGFLARMCCGNRRPWIIRLGPKDPVLVVKRPFRWALQEVEVYGNEGLLLGTVKRSWRGWPLQRNFLIKDQNGELQLQIACPFLSFGWNFTVEDLDGAELGRISKKLSLSAKGIAQELFTDADNFGCEFSARLSPACKALLLGAVFLIDFCFFEDNEVQHQQGRRRR
ncbi:unnamed protein product [Effrenium voratum]|uniref:Phospholipid scramblase n=1 Tax=Effrenium voratum TaxID=2562239 RepID=A0AA36HR06_9DINO|nr:unnamed protein product [Effrenium voratum]